MLVEFSVQNYRSFYERATFSMVASSIKEHPTHVAELSGQRILTTSVFYGANASGKSNLLKAFAFMKDMVLNSSKDTQAGEEIKVEPFLLNSRGADEPTQMEVVFLTDDTLYRYGFTCSSKQVLKEWLFARSTKPKSRELRLFERDAEKDFKVHSRFKEAKDSMLEFLRENIWNISSYMPVHTSVLIKNGLVPQDWISDILVKADLGIKKFQITEREVSSATLKNTPFLLRQDVNKLVSLIINTHHEYYDAEANEFRAVIFDLATQESEGTKQFFSMAGLIYYTLNRGGILFIDEIENSLHPLLCSIIIRLFQDAETNTKGAQLVFTTHNTLLLNKGSFRRDEVWFAEKDSSCSTDLYSLVEYKLDTGKARNDSSYGKDYIRGKYGALPFVDYEDFARLFRNI